MYKWTLLGCYLLVSVLENTNAENKESRTVRISQGAVRGYIDPEGELYTFYNIPYATAPKGPQKFRPPLPPPEWLETFDAVDKGIICPQDSFGEFIPKDKEMKEDCLIANVYVPITEDKPLPVVVYVHGGAFQIGFGDWSPPKNLAKRKIIAVTFNYRLGITGYLCLGTKDIPGNAGMKDQVALLRWVKNNIASFGGNPKDVTIAGCSAGGMSVELLLLSKSTRGLFNKAIPESGSALATFAVQLDPLLEAKHFAMQQSFSNIDGIYALEAFYKSLPGLDSSHDRPKSSVLFSACVERDLGEEVFLDNAPINILKLGNYNKVPLLYGFSEKEGILQAGNFDTMKQLMNKKFSDFIPNDLSFESQEEKEVVAKKIKEFYFGSEPIDETKIHAFIDYSTDILFAYSILRAVKMHVEAGNDEVYLYEYSFVDESSARIPHTEDRGATHCAQTLCVLDGENLNNMNESDISDDYKKMKIIMRDLWSSFIRTGKPVPEDSDLPQWAAVRGDWSPHMSLDRQLKLQGPLLKSRVELWIEVYDKYYKPPVPPPVIPVSHIEL